MNIRIEDYRLVINLFDLFDNLSDETLKNLANVLSCNDLVIQNVADQITDGMTEMGYSGSRSIGLREYKTPLSEAIQKVAESSGEVARKLIEEREKEIGSLKKQLDEKYDEIKSLKERR